MDLETRDYVQNQSWRPGPPAYFSVVPFLLFIAVICWPLLEVQSTTLHNIALGLTLLVVVVTAYRFAMIWSVVFFYDDDGVWMQRGVLPWNKGVYGVKWRDIESAVFAQGFFAWLTRSYPVTIVERYTQRGEMRLPHLWRGNDAVAQINQRLMVMIRGEQPQAGG